MLNLIHEINQQEHTNTHRGTCADIHTHTPGKHIHTNLMYYVYCCYIYLHRYQWFCHFDDDVYVNVEQLSNMLQKYNHNEPYYIGRWPHEIFGDGREFLEVHPQFTCKHYVICLLFVCLGVFKGATTFEKVKLCTYVSDFLQISCISCTCMFRYVCPCTEHQYVKCCVS